MSEVKSIEIYKLFRSKSFTDEEAQLVASAFDQKENVATKEDLLKLKLDLELKMEKGFSAMKMQTTILWLVTILVVIATNPRAIDLIGKVLGIAK
jgi:hypothetical protein